ncbi:hypothetical protein MLD38_008103 [Melastoma candidum]|uniref:Uncharacterized protein n=1 Tax=Melastoma candidum TaxID=119954 RepID=A0ACB9RXK4_9MYRT|nr:hypothetical protein MLD38_008103 [Melastoma candidum]
MLPPLAFPDVEMSTDDSFMSWVLSEMFSDELPENPFSGSAISGDPPHHGHSNSSSNSNSNPISNLGSNNSDSYSNSDGTDPAHPLTNQRKRRMISNRESARRSRMRKQKHLEDLTSEVDRLKFETAGISDQLQSALCHCHRLLSDNEYLRLENSILREKLRNAIPFTRSQQHLQPPAP